MGLTKSRLWIYFLLGALLCGLAYYSLPWAAARNAIYALEGLCAAAAVVVGVRTRSPAYPLPWYLFACGLLSFVVGDSIWSFQEVVLGEAPDFPSAADAFYLAGYPVLAAGLALMVRGHAPGREWPGLLDALIVAAVAGTLSWIFLMAPLADNPGLSLPERLVSLAYPLGDLLLAAVLARLLLVANWRVPAYLLLGGGVLLQMLTDTVYAAPVLAGTYRGGGLLDLGWMLSYASFGAAALHPSVGAPTPSAPDPEPGPITWRRFALLAGALLLAPWAVVAEVSVGKPVGVPAVVGSATLSLLVAARVAGMVRERKRADSALREAEARYRTLVEQIPVATYVQDVVHGHATVYMSPQIEGILGYSPRQYTEDAHLWLRALYPDDRERVLAEDARTDATGEPFGAEYRMICRDGGVVWVQDEAVLVRDAEGRPMHWQGVMLDVTERKKADEELAYRASHDPLTALPNRALFEERMADTLGDAVRPGSGVAVLFLDIDDFKDVNDSLGHRAGDELLERFARRLEASLRPADTVARLGGDEFTVLLEGVAEREAAEVAGRVIEGLRRDPFTLEGRQVFAVPSVGIAVGGHAECGWESLLRRADLALHRAKAEGKGQYECFTPDLEARLAERLRLEGELRLALEREEFRVLYQPKVSIGSGEIVGFEALVRWEHPQRGLLSPSEFISLAEETDLVVPMGRWVLEGACRQAAAWQARYPKDPPLAVSVNLSAKQFRRADLARDIAAVLRESGLVPHALTLEITEETAMEDAPAAAKTLGELKAMGVRIEVDDFGKGYSSLSYLRRFPVDFLKVDRSFVEGLERNKEDEGIVRAVVELAHTLGLTAVGEGVENGEQLGLLREMGCELAQGYYFWGPLTAEAAGELLAAYHGSR